MAILDTIKKIKPLVKTATGYIHLMLSSQSVSMDNGNTLQEEIDEINNNLMVNSIVTCKCSSDISGTAANRYSRGGFQIISQIGNGAEISNSGLKILNTSIVICLGYAQFGQGISAEDYMHCVVGEYLNGGSTPNATWHGQTVAGGPWDSCMISPNMRHLSAGTILYPWVKCEQGYAAHYLSDLSTFTFIIV